MWNSLINGYMHPWIKPRAAKELALDLNTLQPLKLGFALEHSTPFRSSYSMHHRTLRLHTVEEKQQEHPWLSKTPQKRMQKFSRSP